MTMTVLTTLGSLNVRKPKPRDRPEAWSRMTVHSVTSPNWEKYSRKESIHVRKRPDEAVRTFHTVGSLPVQTSNEHLAAFPS